MVRVKISNILTRVKDKITIDDNMTYKRVTIRLYHQGVILRDVVKGTEIGTKEQFLVKPGQFIMSRIDARNGAFGIVPDELENAIITNDFLTFDVNEELVNSEFFKYYSQTRNFLELCKQGSTGTTNRKRLKEERFLNFEVELPDKDIQDKIVKDIEIVNSLEEELKHQIHLCRLLRESILVEKLTLMSTTELI